MTRVIFLYAVLITVFAYSTAYAGSTIILQPDSQNGMDSYIYNLSPDTNFGGDEYASIWDVVDSSTHGVSYMLIKFNIPSSLATLDISNVVFNMAVYPSLNFIKDQSTFAYRITDDWAEGTVTWNSMPAIGENLGQVILPQPMVLLPPVWVTLDITGAFKNWQTGTWGNYGFLIKHDLANIQDPLNLMNFCSSDFSNNSLSLNPVEMRPYLSITVVPEPASVLLFACGLIMFLKKLSRK